jgi:Rrf2 family protein
MKISTKGRYALRLMLELSMSESDRPVRIREIAEKQSISDKYLEQIISILNKAGFVRSIRGPQGGYLLTRKPADYTVGDILRLTEGSLAPVDCADEKIHDCPRKAQCSTVIIWKKIFDAVNEVVDGITLQDIKEWQTSINGDYCI